MKIIKRGININLAINFEDAIHVYKNHAIAEIVSGNCLNTEKLGNKKKCISQQNAEL